MYFTYQAYHTIDTSDEIIIEDIIDEPFLDDPYA